MDAISSQTRIVALDLETTGLSPRRDRVIEVAAVSWQDGYETGHFQTLVNPGCPIPRNVIRIHGITNAMVRDHPPIGEILPAFLNFCAADLVVAHNAPFDVSFLRAECTRTGLPLYLPPVVDSCSLSRQCMPNCASHSLEALKAELGLGSGQAHRALADARDCLAIFLRCHGVATSPVLDQSAKLPLSTEQWALLKEAVADSGIVEIDYRDARGRLTSRRIRPRSISRLTIEAHCLLRDDCRVFYLERVCEVRRSE